MPEAGHLERLTRLETSVNHLMSDSRHSAGRLEAMERAAAALEEMFRGNGRNGMIIRMDRLEQRLDLVWKFLCGGIALALLTIASEILHLILK